MIIPHDTATRTKRLDHLDRIIIDDSYHASCIDSIYGTSPLQRHDRDAVYIIHL